MKKVERIVVGAYQTNCYLLWNDGHVMIVDPGAKAERIIQRIDEQNGIVDAIFVTHGHHDHIGAIDECVKRYNCPVYIHEVEAEVLSNPQYNLSYKSKDIIVKTKPKLIEFSEMNIGAFKVSFMDAPGHSEGCAMMFWDEYLFAGDVLFKQSIGRTDLYRGSNSKMMNTLNEIKKLTQDYILCPGHGDTTTLIEEFKSNPFLN